MMESRGESKIIFCNWHMPVFLLHVEYQNNKKKLSFLFSDKLLKGFTKVLFLDKLNRSVKGGYVVMYMTMVVVVVVC